VVLPAGTTMLAGIEKTAGPPVTTVSVTVVSDGTAGENVTLPVLVAPPVTVLGLNNTDAGVLGATVRVPALLPPFAVAVMETGVEEVTVVVVTGKVADVVPCSTVTLAGIEAIAGAPLPTVKVITVFATTGTVNVTFPVLLAPALTVAGVKETALGELGTTVSVPAFVTPLAVALMDAAVVDITDCVTTVQVALVAPWGTITVAGIELMAEPPLATVKVTVVSAATARPKVTLPVALPPPFTVAGVKVTVVGPLGVTVSEPTTVVPFAAADTLTAVEAATEAVTSENVALELPAGTVMLGGIDVTAAFPAVTVRDTGTSTVAWAARVTVPTVLEPPMSDKGANFRELGMSGVTVKTAVRLAPL
jgi:hypothetical protein